MTRLAITADLHVDAYGSRVDPATGLNARLVDYLQTLRFVASRSGELNADALIVAGDFTERRHPAPWLVAKIREALAEGPERQIYVRGNHDGEIAGGSIVSLLDDGEGVKTGVGRPGLQWVDGVAIACVPHLDRHWLRAQAGFESVPDAELYRILGEQFIAIARGLYALAAKLGPNATLLVCHQAIGGAQMSEAQRAFLGDVSLVVDPGALASIGYSAVVAGHLHRHQVVVPGDRPVLYTGSIERVDFGEEGEPKGFVLLDVDAAGRAKWEFIETPARRFVTVDMFEVAFGANPFADVEGAIVRVRNVDPVVNVADVRRQLEQAGAFEIGSIEKLSVDAPAIEGGLSESLSVEGALEAYFEGDPDRHELVLRGREILAEAAA